MPIISDFVNAILDFVKDQYFAWGYLIVFIGSYLENTIPIGFILPGSTMVLLGGVYAAQPGGPNILLVILLGWAGIFLGSCTDYLLGRFGVIKFAKRNKWLGPKIAKFEPQLEKARAFLEKRGGIAIILAHFVSSMRSIVAFSAGGVGMQFRQFALYSLTAALLWSTTFAGGAYLLGAAFEQVEGYLPFVGVGLTAVILVVYFGVHKWQEAREKERKKLDPDNAIKNQDKGLEEKAA